jgi:hypothetical protein
MQLITLSRNAIRSSFVSSPYAPKGLPDFVNLRLLAL